MRQPETELPISSPAIPRDGSAPLFGAPWQAQAFALTVQLLDRGAFTPAEWADALGRQIAQAGNLASGENYYRHWLQALETLVAMKSLAGARDLEQRRQAWREAAAATPHGEPITLDRLARQG